MLNVESEAQRLAEHDTQQSIGEMPDVARVNVLASKAGAQRIEDGLDAVAPVGDGTTSFGLRVVLFVFEGREQFERGSLASEFLLKLGRVIVAITQHQAALLLQQLRSL